MTQTELTYLDSRTAPHNQHCKTQPPESGDESIQSERRRPVLGVLILLATALVFYAGIAALILKFR